MRAHDVRKANREARARAEHPRTAGVRLALTKPPQHETRWAKGARGEALVAASLEQRSGERVRFLHDRRVAGSRANIDHIAIGPSGVWVIDAKHYSGKVAIENPWRQPARLRIDGRDQSKLIDGLDRQVAVVRTFLASVDADAPVHGALCFVDADLPMLRTLSFRGYPLLWRKQLAKRLRAAGPLTDGRITRLTRDLATAFPAA